MCDALGIVNTRDAVGSLDDDEKNTLRLMQGNKGNPIKTIVNEPGLYSLILRSRKPEAQDICDVLGLTNPTMSLRHLHEREKSTLSRTEVGLKPGPSINIINESGLYKLLLKSLDDDEKFTLINPDGNPRDALSHLDDDEKSYLRRVELGLPPGKPMVIVNEPGLHNLIMNSKKPEAHEFKRWVTHEVMGYQQASVAVKMHCNYPELLKYDEMSSLDILPLGKLSKTTVSTRKYLNLTIR